MMPRAGNAFNTGTAALEAGPGTTGAIVVAIRRRNQIEAVCAMGIGCQAAPVPVTPGCFNSAVHDDVSRAAADETMSGLADVPAAAGSSLGADRIDTIVDALNYRPTLRDRIGDDPWNTVSSLLLAGLYAGLVIRSELLGLAMPSISWVGILASPVFLYWAWSENNGTRVFGWFWLVTFTVVLPLIGFYFRWKTLGRTF